MSRTNKIYGILIASLLMINMGLGALQISLQIENIENQEALISYLSVVAGEALEQSTTEANLDIHSQVRVYGPDGNLKFFSEHAGTLTDTGKEWIEAHLGNNDTTPSAQWISCSNDGTSPQSSWDMLPAEINGSGLARAQGSYYSNGTGQWSIIHTFSVTGTQSLQLIGLSYGGGSNHFLVASDEVSQINAENGDTVKVKWYLTVS